MIRLRFATCCCASVLLFLAASPAKADLLTFYFSGTFNSNSVMFASGDSYAGSYTFDPTVAPSSHPDSTLNIQALTISPALVGTSWELSVDSSVVSPFDISGNYGTIAMGDNTSFGDRYIATLYGTAPGILPGGLDLNFFQLDLQNSMGASSDLLSDENLNSLPSLENATHAGGRFFISNPPDGCTQCQHSLSTLSAVPEPGSTTAIAALMLCSAFFLRRRKHARVS